MNYEHVDDDPGYLPAILCERDGDGLKRAVDEFASDLVPELAFELQRLLRRRLITKGYARIDPAAVEAAGWSEAESYFGWFILKVVPDFKSRRKEGQRVPFKATFFALVYKQPYYLYRMDAAERYYRREVGLNQLLEHVDGVQDAGFDEALHADSVSDAVSKMLSCIEKLPDRTREVMIGRYAQSKSIAVVAKSVRISVRRAHEIIKAGLEETRKCMSRAD